MVATVAWKGYGRASIADIATETWGAIKITSGGGGPTAVAADGALEGTTAVTCTSNNKRVYLYYDIGAGNELDFSGGGTEEGDLVYIWGNFLAAALLQTQATGGFGIFLESSTPTSTQYHLYYFYGSDNYAGGWKRLILDPTKTASSSSGTAIDLSAIRYFGVFGDTTATARFDNLICDAIDVGTGISVYGTSTTDDLMGDILTDEETNRYGIVTSLNDPNSSLGLAGTVEFGDNVGTNAATLTDENAKLFLEEPLYYETTEKASVPLTFGNINCVGNATGATSVTIGKKVGTGDTAKGRSGYTLVGNPTYDLGMVFDDGNVNTMKWYGSNLVEVTGAFTHGTNTAHEFIGNSVTECGTLDLGSVIARALTFTSTELQGVSKYAALDWDGSGTINLKNSDFIANTDAGGDIAHAIEHKTAGTFTYEGLLFSGNEVDVWFSATTGNLIIEKTGGADPSTSTNDSTGTVSFTASFTHTLTDLAENTEVTYVLTGSPSTVVFHVENVGVSGETTYTHSGGELVNILVFHIDKQPGVSDIYDITLPNGDASVKISQFDDDNYYNP